MDAVEEARSVFEGILIWKPSGGPVPVDRIVEGMAEPDLSFVRHVYEMAEGLYRSLPPRKNGQPAFTHPTNVAQFLKMARAQAHVVAAGLLHDILEDRVDVEKAQGVHDLAQLELVQRAIRGQFGSAVIYAASRSGFPREIAERVVEVVDTLTRHKADLYYKSISGIFMHTDLVIRLAASIVKLADRMHNIETIENYNDDEKIYQCFKNIFILNNAKQFRSEIVDDRRLDPRMLDTLHKAFKKCGKATFEALHRIDHQSNADAPIFELVKYLALALRKFTLEMNGLWKVTDANLEPGAPVYNVFHGIVNKYDAWLHHEDEDFQSMIAAELEYFSRTFITLGLDEEELRRAINFKDAMALKEVVALLLYRDEYVIRGFECSLICRRGRNCRKVG